MGSRAYCRGFNHFLVWTRHSPYKEHFMEKSCSFAGLLISSYESSKNQASLSRIPLAKILILQTKLGPSFVWIMGPHANFIFINYVYKEKYLYYVAWGPCIATILDWERDVLDLGDGHTISLNSVF